MQSALLGIHRAEKILEWTIPRWVTLKQLKWVDPDGKEVSFID